MRTIDPFIAPGLWGGPSNPSQSSLTAGQSSHPPRRPAVIATLPQNIDHAPLASLAGSVLGPRFHAWYGRSGRRTICSVYPVLEDQPGRGLPDFTCAIVIAAGRDNGRLSSLVVFAFGENEDKSASICEAISAGALEWHVHLLAQDSKARSALLQDLTGRISQACD